MHIVIIAGGHLDIDFADSYLKTLSYDKVFAVDKGLEYADQLGLLPDFIVGDFDSVDIRLLESYERRITCGGIFSDIERHPVKKDATDTELAVIKALEDGAGQITILAATGSRLDHSLANIGLLMQTAKRGVDAYIVDAANRIRLLSSEDKMYCRIKKEEQQGTYLSLLPLTSEVEGVTIRGVLYPLEEETLSQGNTLTVSNQITEREAWISISQGMLLVIESRD